MNWYLEVWKKYAVFAGRARRKEYWFFVLFNIIFSLIIGVIDGILGLGGTGSLGILSIIYSLAVIIPSIAVTVRRLHDIGKSGWWALILIIPFIGAIVLLVFTVMDSQPGSNQYGPNPK